VSQSQEAPPPSATEERQKFIDQMNERIFQEESERRRFLYQDVERILEDGYLIHHVQVGQTRLLFRSLDRTQSAKLRARLLGCSPQEALRWAIASSLWMVDGLDLWEDYGSNSAYHAMQEWLEAAPDVLVEVLYGVIQGFHLRFERAVDLVEAYCYEPYSRSHWRMMGRPTKEMGQGNVLQRIWGAFNYSEDLFEAEEREWVHTRSVMGSMSNKAAKHLREQLENAERREKERRARVIQDAVNRLIQGQTPEPEPLRVTVGGRDVEVRSVMGPQSISDLEQEMQNLREGKQDYHDMVVQEYQNQIRRNTEKRRQERERAILAARAKADAAIEEGQAPLVGYTPEQLKELGIKRGKKTTETFQHASAKENHLYSRYFGRDIRPGQVKIRGAAYPTVSDLDPPPQEAPSKPSLQEQIAQRQPKLNTQE
jgi:hypothetical protein